METNGTILVEWGGKLQCGVIGVPVLHPVETSLKKSKCLAVILVRLYDHSNRLPAFIVVPG